MYLNNCNFYGKLYFFIPGWTEYSSVFFYLFIYLNVSFTSFFFFYLSLSAKLFIKINLCLLISSSSSIFLKLTSICKSNLQVFESWRPAAKF